MIKKIFISAVVTRPRKKDGQLLAIFNNGQAYVLVSQLAASGIQNPHHLRGYSADVEYFKVGELLASGEACRDEGVIMKDFRPEPAAFDKQYATAFRTWEPPVSWAPAAAPTRRTVENPEGNDQLPPPDPNANKQKADEVPADINDEMEEPAGEVLDEALPGA